MPREESLFGEVEEVEVKIDRILQGVQANDQRLAALQIGQAQQSEKIDRILKALEPPLPVSFRITLTTKD